jgi:hypothetical protein
MPWRIEMTPMPYENSFDLDIAVNFKKLIAIIVLFSSSLSLKYCILQFWHPTIYLKSNINLPKRL